MLTVITSPLHSRSGSECKGLLSTVVTDRAFTIEAMGRQTQLHVLPKDVNDLLIVMQDNEPLEVALRSGNSFVPESLAFVPENMTGLSLILWSQRFAPNLQRRFVATEDSPFYLADEQTEPVFELSLSGVTTWNGRPALTQGRIYGVFQNKQAEFEKCYEQILRDIRRHWRKNPATWMGGYVSPVAGDGFDRGGLLYPTIFRPFATIGFNVWANSTHID